MNKFQNIKLNIETLDLMRKNKIKFNKKTYDNLITFSLKYLNNLDIENEKSKADILLKNDYDLSKRQEQFFKRLGALETKYFKNILTISDSIKEINMKNSKGNEDLEVHKKELKKTMYENSELRKNIKSKEAQVNHLDNLIDKKQKVINNLQKKIIKSSGVFSSGYEMKLSESEYKEIFE